LTKQLDIQRVGTGHGAGPCSVKEIDQAVGHTVGRNQPRSFAFCV